MLLGFAHFCVIRFTLLLLILFRTAVVRARACVFAKEPARFFEEQRVDIRSAKTALKMFRVLVQKAQNPKHGENAFRFRNKEPQNKTIQNT